MNEKKESFAELFQKSLGEKPTQVNDIIKGKVMSVDD